MAPKKAAKKSAAKTVSPPSTPQKTTVGKSRAVKAKSTRAPIASPARSKRTAPKTAVKKVAARRATRKGSARIEVSLGRPLVSQEEKLFMLFHDDFQARQVFEFLRVETIKDLEQFNPQEIIDRMSKPLRMTVDRIRQRLAQFKRALKDDQEFAADYRRQTTQD